MTSKEFEDDRSFVEANIQLLHDFSNSIKSLNFLAESTLNLLVKMIQLREECQVRVYNLWFYIAALKANDITRSEVKAMDSKVSDLLSRLAQSVKPLDHFLMTTDEAIMKRLLSISDLKPYAFLWNKNREQKEHLLSNDEEALLEALSVNGHTAWMNLYYDIVGSMKCTLVTDEKEMTVSLSEASAIMYGSSEADRKSAWHSIQAAWKAQQESAAGILNALAGWRIEVSKKRSKIKTMDFLTQALFDNRIEENTLNALIECCRTNLKRLRQAPRAMAKVAGKGKLDPWDLTASYPKLANGTSKSVGDYREGFRLVRDAFDAISSDMAQFANLANQNAWIDARILATKSVGGFCMEFSKSREPRIFMTYRGSMNDISTLAHELGHGYHYWKMRDIHRVEAQYPSTLAETASVFAEQALRDYLSQRLQTEDRLEAGWTEMEMILAYLIDIPSRFEFEKKFHERRIEQTLTAGELCELIDEARTNWYGDTVSANDNLFWASKLHFASSGSGFYNFPYAFGYLFAMNLYARRKEHGPTFNQTYVDILRDTGRLTAEELVQKHLNEDIRKPQFWQKS